jgi:hypothetical protein
MALEPKIVIALSDMYLATIRRGPASPASATSSMEDSDSELNVVPITRSPLDKFRGGQVRKYRSKRVRDARRRHAVTVSRCM